MPIIVIQEERKSSKVMHNIEKMWPKQIGQIKMGEKKNPRIPRKKGQPRRFFKTF